MTCVHGNEHCPNLRCQEERPACVLCETTACRCGELAELAAKQMEGFFKVGSIDLCGSCGHVDSHAPDCHRVHSEAFFDAWSRLTAGAELRYELAQLNLTMPYRTVLLTGILGERPPTYDFPVVAAIEHGQSGCGCPRMMTWWDCPDCSPMHSPAEVAYQRERARTR